MTDDQTQLVELTKQVESLRQEIKEINPLISELLNKIGVGTLFQDPTDNVVFKVTVPKGRFVEFVEIGYDRTKRGDEKRGALSMKEAKEAGFTL